MTIKEREKHTKIQPDRQKHIDNQTNKGTDRMSDGQTGNMSKVCNMIIDIYYEGIWNKYVTKKNIYPVFWCKIYS